MPPPMMTTCASPGSDFDTGKPSPINPSLALVFRRNRAAVTRHRVAPRGKIVFGSASASMRAAMTSRSASAYGSETGRPRAEDKVPGHSSFSVNHQGRFRDSDTFRLVFEPASTERKGSLGSWVGGSVGSRPLSSVSPTIVLASELRGENFCILAESSHHWRCVEPTRVASSGQSAHHCAASGKS